MENYPILFPPSSSVSPSSSTVSYLAQNMMNPHIFTGFHGNSTGFLGLKREADTQAPDGVNTHQIEDFNGSENEEKLDKKKGGKRAKKPRYAFETRSQVDILDDGYRWRKYGQKAVKNNRFPRSYYRCTHQECNVKKQVQRLSKDEGVVVTTYEGIHTHPIERSTDNFEHILSQMQIYSTS